MLLHRGILDQVIICFICLVGLLIGAGALCPVCCADSILLNNPSATVAESSQASFAHGQKVQGYELLLELSQDDMIRACAGKPREKMLRKFGGDFSEYWKASESSYAGKGFEAMTAFQENERLARLGDPRRFVPTAALGKPGAPADLLLLDSRTGRVLQQWQSKLGYRATLDALQDSKYAGMSIVAPQEVVEAIQGDLARQEIKAARRGLPLSQEWEPVRKAFQEERLTLALPSGEKATSRVLAETGTEKVISRSWLKLEQEARIADQAAAGTESLSVIGSAGRLLGSSLLVLDVATTAYLTYGDYGRWQGGEISGSFFAFKATLRSSQLALTAYGVFSPDFTLTSKAGAFILAGVLVVADVVSDPVYEAWTARTRELLASMERDERYYFARQEVMKWGSGPR